MPRFVVPPSGGNPLKRSRLKAELHTFSRNSPFLIGFKEIGIGGGNAFEGIGRTGAGDGAFVAVDAEVVFDLHIHRSVAEHIASLNAFTTANAQILINGVLIVGLLNKGALNGGCRAELVFRAGISGFCIGPQITAAEVAVTADGIGVETFNSGRRQHTMRRATSALRTLFRINLPHQPGRQTTPGRDHRSANQHGCRTSYEITAVSILFRIHLSPRPHFPPLNFEQRPH
jgi:hypothetical protein